MRRQDFSSLWNLRQDKHSGQAPALQGRLHRSQQSAVSLLNKKMWKWWWRHTRRGGREKACRTHGSKSVTYFSRWYNIQWISVSSHYRKLSWFMWGLVGNVINWLHNCANNLQFTATNKHRGRKTQTESDYHLRTETHSPSDAHLHTSRFSRCAVYPPEGAWTWILCHILTFTSRNSSPKPNAETAVTATRYITRH